MMSESESLFFTCYHCGREYLKARSDAEALLDAELTWGCVPDEEDRAVLCGPCNALFVTWLQSTGQNTGQRTTTLGSPTLP
jgi:hypothetical protein